MLDAGYEAAQNRVDLMLKAAKPDDGPWLKLLWALSMDSGHQEKPDACLRVVRLTKEPRSRPSLKVRVGRRETIAALSREHAKAGRPRR
jgi:hypothetical protein